MMSRVKFESLKIGAEFKTQNYLGSLMKTELVYDSQGNQRFNCVYLSDNLEGTHTYINDDALVEPAPA